MAGRVSGKDGEIFYNGQDMSGESNSFTINVENDNFEVTSFGDAAKTFVEGKYGWTVEIEAFFDSASNKWGTQLFTNLGAGAKAMTIGPEGTAVAGDEFWTGSAFVTSFNEETPVDGAITISATLQGSGALVRNIKA